MVTIALQRGTGTAHCWPFGAWCRKSAAGPTTRQSPPSSRSTIVDTQS